MEHPEFTYKKEGKLIMVKLGDGENVVNSLKELVKENKLRSGLILGGVGMLRDVELS